MKTCMLIGAACASALLAGPAFAQADTDTDVRGGSGVTIGAELNLLSDYRFRGISRSDGDPAVQGALTLSSDSGFYVGARGTSLKRRPTLGDAEVDLYAGFGTDIGLGASVDAGVMYYVFPDGTGRTDYVEPYASVSYLFGPLEATAGAKYAPAQDALGGEDMLYLFTEAEAGIPLTPFTLTAQAGRQDAGAFGDYYTWSLGARASFGPVNAGVRYVDTDLNLPNAEAGVVLSLGVRF